MRKWIGVAAIAGATVGAPTRHAETTANIALVSDYVFRGVSLSDNGPAIQGGFDWSSEMLYAGAWASSLSEDMEIDLYAGLTRRLVLLSGISARSRISIRARTMIWRSTTTLSWCLLARCR